MAKEMNLVGVEFRVKNLPQEHAVEIEFPEGNGGLQHKVVDAVVHKLEEEKHINVAAVETKDGHSFYITEASIDGQQHLTYGAVLRVIENIKHKEDEEHAAHHHINAGKFLDEAAGRKRVDVAFSESETTEIPVQHMTPGLVARSGLHANFWQTVNEFKRISSDASVNVDTIANQLGLAVSEAIDKKQAIKPVIKATLEKHLQGDKKIEYLTGELFDNAHHIIPGGREA